ncbi:MAG: hypothetical protein M0C28_44220 [Candidatus Moduliflexus flocculans]|nr:hypothetical protein [Candidatus Moduliflexus flocculans]
MSCASARASRSSKWNDSRPGCTWSRRLLSLYLGFGKRRAELALLAQGAGSHRKVLDGYTLPLLDQYITIVSGTTIVAYSLYTFSAPNLPENHSMMLTIPFVVYTIFRYLLSHRTSSMRAARRRKFCSPTARSKSPCFCWGIAHVFGNLLPLMKILRARQDHPLWRTCRRVRTPRAGGAGHTGSCGRGSLASSTAPGSGSTPRT